MRPSPHLLAAAVLAVAASACAEEKAPPGTLSSARFVAVNVALRTAPYPTPRYPALRADSLQARRDTVRIRNAVLARERATPEELYAFIDARRDHPAELEAAWKQIERKVAAVDSTRLADSLKAEQRAGASAKKPAPAPASTRPPVGGDTALTPAPAVSSPR